jgi:hypothetical protein
MGPLGRPSLIYKRVDHLNSVLWNRNRNNLLRFHNTASVPLSLDSDAPVIDLIMVMFSKCHSNEQRLLGRSFWPGVPVSTGTGTELLTFPSLQKRGYRIELIFSLSYIKEDKYHSKAKSISPFLAFGPVKVMWPLVGPAWGRGRGGGLKVTRKEI